MQLVTLFRFVEVLLDAPGGAVLTFSTDLPGNAMVVRGTASIPATTGRHPYRLSLSGATKGKLYSLRVAPAGASAVRIYAAKVYARALGPAASAWQWYAVPVLETPVDWQPVQLPIPKTPEDWQPVKLPIPETPEAFSPLALPIPKTGDDWQAVKLPIPPTPEDWTPAPLPVKTTPPVPDWVQVQVDQ